MEALESRPKPFKPPTRPGPALALPPLSAGVLLPNVAQPRGSWGYVSLENTPFSLIIHRQNILVYSDHTYKAPARRVPEWGRFN